MQTTGIFQTSSYQIHVKKLNEPIYLIPFGDIHRSSHLCHEEKWKEFLDWAKTKDRCLFLGMGDYDDLGSSSERKILLSPDLHDTTTKTLEKTYATHTARFVKEIEFMRGRIIGFVEGNHYGQYANGQTTTQRMCELLNARYLGVSAFIRLSFKGNGHESRSKVDIWAHHGKGAARLIGGSLNRVQQMAEAAEADIYLMGHDHKKSVATTTRLRLNTGDADGSIRLSHRKIIVARTGSFLKGYVDGEPSYVADSAMNPTDLGVVKIEMTPRRIRHRPNTDIFYIDLHASI